MEKQYTLEVGTILHEKYQIEKILGQGGFGITYVVNQIDTGVSYAMKEYFPREICTRDKNGCVVPKEFEKDAFAHGLEVFDGEAIILLCLVNEPGIIHVFDHFRENETAYFIMEYLEGFTLAEVLHKRKTLSIKEAEMILFSLMKSLKTVHSVGIVHRDISPENIFITKEGNVVLLDFGTARKYVSDKSISMSVELKMEYAPLEQYSMQGKQGPWTDVYSLAACFYRMLTGYHIPNAMERVKGKPYTPIANYVPDIGQNVEEVLREALAPNYEERIQSMDEFFQRLQSNHR